MGLKGKTIQLMEENVRKNIVPYRLGCLLKNTTPPKYNHRVKKDVITSELRISGK